jgi:probable phosphoglycerate mutase
MLVLVRHGQSHANAAGLLVGRADSPLTELGRRQAAAISNTLASSGSSSGCIFTSPLRRAAETAQAIAGAVAAQGARVEVVVDDRFVELDYGELDGKAPSMLPASFWNTWRSDSSFRPRGGETLLEVTERVSAALAEIVPQAADRDVVVVSHVSPIKAAVAWALGTGPQLTWRLSLGVASITRIAIDARHGPSLVSYNETAHLAMVA